MYHIFAVMSDGSGHKHVRADNLTELLDFLVGTMYDMITVFELQYDKYKEDSDLVQIWTNENPQ